MSTKKFYGAGLPGVDLEQLHGRLIVIEGADGSGRSTQIVRLTAWLESKGFAVSSIPVLRERPASLSRIAKRIHSIELVVSLRAGVVGSDADRVDSSIIGVARVDGDIVLP